MQGKSKIILAQCRRRFVSACRAVLENRKSPYGILMLPIVANERCSMRTSIIAKDSYGRFMRGAKTSEVGADKTYRRPRFWPKGAVEGHTSDGKPWIRKTDVVYFGNNGFDFKRGKIDDLRDIDESLICNLDKLDKEIESLMKERNELTEYAYLRGKPVTLEQAREWFTKPTVTT